MDQDTVYCTIHIGMNRIEHSKYMRTEEDQHTIDRGWETNQKQNTIDSHDKKKH